MKIEQPQKIVIGLIIGALILGFAQYQYKKIELIHVGLAILVFLFIIFWEQLNQIRIQETREDPIIAWLQLSESEIGKKLAVKPPQETDWFNHTIKFNSNNELMIITQKNTFMLDGRKNTQGNPRLIAFEPIQRTLGEMHKYSIAQKKLTLEAALDLIEKELSIPRQEIYAITERLKEPKEVEEE